MLSFEFILEFRGFRLRLFQNLGLFFMLHQIFLGLLCPLQTLLLFLSLQRLYIYLSFLKKFMAFHELSLKRRDLLRCFRIQFLLEGL